MRIPRTIIWTLSMTCSLLPGCALGNSCSVSRVQNFSLGQELTDAKRAADSGAITPAQAERLKHCLLEQQRHQGEPPAPPADVHTSFTHNRILY